MESINQFKGYGKVNPENLENQTQHSNSKPPKPQKPFFSTLIISAILFSTLVIALILAALIHVSTTNSSSSPLSPSISAESTIKTICNVTRHPDTCFTSISSLNAAPKPDPISIFNLSLEASAAELSTLLSLFKTVNADPATGDCVGQLDDALSRLNDSVLAVGEGPLTEGKFNDMQTWISGALTDQETCLDGLEEMGSTAVDEVKGKMKRSMECTSNSLAIVANFKAILDKFHMPIH